ncbi:hypothetical protein Toce_2244 [Thermosediminibacter oceani DSM 16646]|uniref:Uncharacterized protein n=1 Tax=Thermosediminibacter oceani (strain ATCC BAA-1034 / DSM 16646 / JW/IW-1228P) TaxID=555079 RepID=D9S176_THEOJ|nr:hypothetical protein Toce_2244 [Thermosediminibacter oceani DSM 16646]
MIFKDIVFSNTPFSEFFLYTAVDKPVNMCTS